MDITYYFPWIRKGLSNCINELDTLGSTTNMESLTLHRPKLFITPNYDITPVAKSDKDKPKPVVRTETKEVEFISPGDITNINKNAIIRVVPKEKSDTFPKDYLPYIEFYEPDFPWRYSPALPNDDKLRPWLAILVCKNDEFSLEKSSGDSMYVSLKITTETEYKAIFLSPQETWKAAHAQGKDNVNPIYSRLLAMRREDLERQTEYTAFLVPLFETGRLRGLGYGDEDMVTIAAQASAWEENLALQKQHHPKRPLDFPVYHYWTFKTGEESFDALAERLTAQNITELGLPADIQVNVTDMGEGLSYSQLSFPYGNPREVIGVPVATVPIDYLKGQAFPYPQGVEIELYERMKDLLSKNPVFVENLSEISGEALEGEQIGDDDPWVSPPIYGGKHAMATSLETKDNRETPWIPELNTDVHNRIAAGMGKKIVQENQEEFVNRAWKQVDAITALNQELRQRLLSSNTGNSIRKRITKGIQKNQKNAYLSLLMKYLDSLKYASTDSGSSLAKVLNDNKIPLSFATATFHQLTSGIEGINETDLLDRITTEQIFRMKPHDLLNLTSMKHIRWLVKNKDNILDSVFQNHVFNIFDLYANDDSNAISDFFIITKKTKNISGEIDIDQLKEIYSYVGKEICFTNKLRNGKYTSGI
ncbi:hypothetical protein LJC69_06590, partial [Bacteroidales bacterium OttesenSCG-928-K22]|nr:hypothetical protein [Bacteroidales bacterium OttesenSCG-928-K22]